MRRYMKPLHSPGACRSHRSLPLVSRGRLDENTGNEESYTTYFECLTNLRGSLFPKIGKILKLVQIFESSARMRLF
jgi:hypothetical protein